MSLIDIAIITGAGQGIGKEIALDFGSREIFVLCISKSENCKNTALEINKNGGKAGYLVLDIANYEQAENLISTWINKTQYQRIGVILAAGVVGPQGPLDKTLIKDWEQCFKINLFGNLAVVRALLPRMLESKFGRIVTFSGGGAAYAFPLFPAYSASKTAVVRATENLHEGLKNKGNFAIVCLAPGAIETSMLNEVRNAGAEIRTVTSISEPITFVREFINASSCNFSGSLVHVRDQWKNYINNSIKLSNDSMWKLRRVE